MSLESGRKLGLAASIIAVVTPVVAVAAVVFFIWSLIANLFSNLIGPNTSSSTLSALTWVIIVFIIILLIISVAGSTLFVVAMRRLAQYYNDPGIFKNALHGFLINIIGIVTSITIYTALTISSLTNISNSNPQTTVAYTPIPTVPPLMVTSFFTVYLVLAAVFFVLSIVSAVLYMRAFNKLGEKSGVDNFRTAGLLYLLGGALAIVGIGVLLSWIAWILAAMGFHSLKPKTTETATSSYSTNQLTPNPSAIQRRYCTYCGADNNIDALYCRSCGKQLQ